MGIIARVMAERGEFDLAQTYINQAVNAVMAKVGPDSIPYAVALANRGGIEQLAHQFSAAAEDYDKALKLVRVHAELRHLERDIVQHYAAVLKAMHRGREAKAIAVEAGGFRPR